MSSHMVIPNQTPHSAKQVEGLAMKKIIASIGLCLLIAGMPILAAAKSPKADPRPIAENSARLLIGVNPENHGPGPPAVLAGRWPSNH
jgi:hypothetical protein